MQDIKRYVSENKQRFLDELFELLRFPSVSADPKFKADMLRTAEYVAEKLKIAGADEVEICPTAGYPIVYGEKIIDAVEAELLVALPILGMVEGADRAIVGIGDRGADAGVAIVGAAGGRGDHLGDRFGGGKGASLHEQARAAPTE